jgi:hypothetical protein
MTHALIKICQLMHVVFQVTTHMIFSILAVATAAVQLGMGAGSAVADHVALKVSRDNENLKDFLKDHYSSGLDYFFRFGCSDKQRSTYPTVRSLQTCTLCLA